MRSGGYPTSESDAIAEASGKLLKSQMQVRVLEKQVQDLRSVEEKQQTKHDTLQRATDTYAGQTAALRC